MWRTACVQLAAVLARIHCLKEENLVVFSKYPVVNFVNAVYFPVLSGLNYGVQLGSKFKVFNFIWHMLFDLQEFVRCYIFQIWPPTFWQLTFNFFTCTLLLSAVRHVFFPSGVYSLFDFQICVRCCSFQIWHPSFWHSSFDLCGVRVRTSRIMLYLFCFVKSD